MKLKLDENLPASLVGALSALGHDVDSVRTERLEGHPDADVWRAATSSGRLLVTQDLDFSDLRQFAPGTHEGILLVRLKSPGRRALFNRVKQAFEREDAEQWRRCFVVLTETKLRVRAPRAK